MRTADSTKKYLLYRFLKCLHQCLSSWPNMSLPQRKRATKLSADINMAFARSGSKWSRALILRLCKQKSSNFILGKLVGNEELDRMKQEFSSTSLKSKSKIKASLMIIRKSRSMVHKVRRNGVAPNKIKAKSLARLIQKKRARMSVLKSLVPGGGLMDELTLLEETTDYVCALQDQIDVMKRLVDALEQPSKCL